MPANIAVIAEKPVAPAKAPVLYHYGIVRADLPTITQTVQLYHAAGESSPGKLPKGTFARVLQVADEAALKAIGWELFRAGVKIAMVFEPDEPWNGQLMAIGVEPVLGGTLEYSRVRKILQPLDRLEQPEK